MYITEEGVISAAPLVIQAIVLKPSGDGDAASFVFWNESDSPVTTYGTMNNKTVTATASTKTFASTGNFETDSINAYQIIKIHATSSGDNIGTYQIATNADDNTITVTNPASIFGQAVTLADDTSEIYSYRVWDTHPLITLKTSGITSDKGEVQKDWGPKGFRVPNLAMNTLSSGAVAYIYLR